MIVYSIAPNDNAQKTIDTLSKFKFQSVWQKQNGVYETTFRVRGKKIKYHKSDSMLIQHIKHLRHTQIEIHVALI